MRKLAPVFLMTSMLAFAGGALANNTDKTDKVTGSPTVSANKSTGENLSYSDKSNASTGTNAKMDKAKKHKNKNAKTDSTMDTTTMDATTGTTADTTLSAPVSPSTTSSAPIPAPTAGGTTGATTNSTTGVSPQ